MQKTAEQPAGEYEAITCEDAKSIKQTFLMDRH
jgi:hypothetical protein